MRRFGDLDLHQRGQHSLIEQHSLGACNIGQHQEERGDMEETKKEETEIRDSEVYSWPVGLCLLAMHVLNF